MTHEDVIMPMQAAAIVLGVFVACWGLYEFGYCLYRVLCGRYNRPNVRDLCPYHAVFAMFCISTLLFCAARASAIGMLPISEVTAGAFFIAGMNTTCLTVGLAIWAKSRTHNGSPLMPLDGHPALSRVFAMMMIIILAFVLLGLVRAGT